MMQSGISNLLNFNDPNTSMGYNSIEELEDAIMAKQNPPTNSGGIRALMAGGSPEFGGVLKGPGTGTSDSIPGMIFQDGKPVQRAALSNNEFVFTERAVKGAGNGNIDKGIATMYDLMDKFEGMA